MAEGFGRVMLGHNFEVYSAGIEKHGLNPYAVRVMAEAGIDISKHVSKKINELPVSDFDYVITVCGHANETCPFFPAKTALIHRGFDDPPKLTENIEDEEERLNIYRRVRNEIRDYIKSIVDNGF